MLKSVFLALFTVTLLTPSAFAESDADKKPFSWQQVEEGFWYGRYTLKNNLSVIQSDVVLLKFSPEKFSFHVGLASSVDTKRTTIRALTHKLKGIAGINANFFDPEEKPLGLIISDKTKLNRMHQGGSLLTGVFFINEQVPQIVHRSRFDATNVSLALQSGPRLIENNKKLKLSVTQKPNRRSGIAITKKNEVIIFATVLRFPGATFSQLQDMLLDPSIDAHSALNFDGGGSSQLYMTKQKSIREVSLTGGDVVPVGLIVKPKL